MIFKTYSKVEIEEKKTKLKPGNFLVTHGHDFFDRLIQIFTASHWNHAALIVSSGGTIVELEPHGIRKKHISEYTPNNIYVIDIPMSSEDRKQVVTYADVMLKRHTIYGFITIVSIAFKIMTKSRLVLKLDGTLICSEFVARALSQGGIIWDKDPSLITPEDLYRQFVE